MHRSSPVKRFCILISTNQLDNLHTKGENVDKSLPRQYNRERTGQEKAELAILTTQYSKRLFMFQKTSNTNQIVQPFLHDIEKRDMYHHFYMMWETRYVSLIFNLDKMLTTVKRVRVHIKYLCINIHNWIYIWCENYFHLAISAV